MRSILKNKRGKNLLPLQDLNHGPLELNASALDELHFQKVAKEQQNLPNLNVLDFSGQLCHLGPEYSDKVALVLNMALGSGHASTSCSCPVS